MERMSSWVIPMMRWTPWPFMSAQAYTQHFAISKERFGTKKLTCVHAQSKKSLFIANKIIISVAETKFFSYLCIAYMVEKT